MAVSLDGAVRWPVDAAGVRLRMSDRVMARMPAVTERVWPRILAQPAGSPARRRVLTRALVAGFAATDARDYEYLERILEPDAVISIDVTLFPGLPPRIHGFSELRAAIEELFTAFRVAVNRPIEVVDFGGPELAVRAEVAIEGLSSGVGVAQELVYLYEVSERGRIGRQWWVPDLEAAAATRLGA